MITARKASRPRRSLACFGVAVAAACTLGAVDPCAAEATPANPPRTQQDMQRERMAACHGLHGAELKDCMANYVGGAYDQSQPPSDGHEQRERNEIAAPAQPTAGPDTSESGAGSVPKQ
jgi:hypothetical protein